MLFYAAPDWSCFSIPFTLACTRFGFSIFSSQAKLFINCICLVFPSGRRALNLDVNVDVNVNVSVYVNLNVHGIVSG